MPKKHAAPTRRTAKAKIARTVRRIAKTTKNARIARIAKATVKTARKPVPNKPKSAPKPPLAKRLAPRNNHAVRLHRNSA